MTRLLTDQQLESSFVVANCRMNRERELIGDNGYERELGLHPLDFLRARPTPTRWLDLCCGTGRALFQAADLLAPEEKVAITGVDLIDRFWPEKIPASLRLITASLRTWTPTETFDLITCVHGLHYVGDKLGLIARMASWLTDDGVFVANLDVNNICDENRAVFVRRLPRWLRDSGLEYDTQRHRLMCRGRREIRLPLEYVGADDSAGPNYTGQAAVHSLYRLIPVATDP